MLSVTAAIELLNTHIAMRYKDGPICLEVDEETECCIIPDNEVDTNDSVTPYLAFVRRAECNDWRVDDAMDFLDLVPAMDVASVTCWAGGRAEYVIVVDRKTGECYEPRVTVTFDLVQASSVPDCVPGDWSSNL